MDSELHKSILSGDITMLRALIENGASINKLHGIKGTPLCAAIANNKLDIVTFLLGMESCDKNGADFDGEPPLCLAISKGYTDIARALIRAKGCNLNAVDPVMHKTPLCIAVCEGNADVIKSLIEAGCDVNKATERGNTALHYAVTDSRLDIVELLLTGGASLSKYNNNGHSVLHHSVYREEVECTRLLLEHLRDKPADLKEQVINAQTQIHSDSCLHLAVEVGSLALLELLLNYQSDIDVANSTGHSPLYSAVKKNSIQLAACLLKAGANPNVACYDTVNRRYQVEKRSSSMLHAAVITGNLELVKMLLEHGASANSLDFRGNNPLMVALNQNKPAIARHLLKNSDVKVLARNDRQENCLFAAMSCSDPAWFVKELAVRGCSVNERNIDEQTPLHMAVDFECTEVIDVLLDNGCDMNALCADDNSVLHVSAMNGCTDTTRMLLFYGADADALDANGQTPLSIALEMEYYEIASILLESGADAHGLVDNYDSIEQCVDVTVQDEEWQQSITKLLTANYPVQKLSEICRKTVRHHFIESNISMKKMALLPIPQRIIRFLSFRV